MLENGLAFCRLRVNVPRVKIRIQALTGFYLQQCLIDCDAISKF